MRADSAAPWSRRITAAAVLSAAAVLAATLFVPPIVGLADNGDFDRLSVPAGLASVSRVPGDRFFGWMQPRFVRVARALDPSAFRSSESLLVELASFVQRALSGSPVFDVRFLGAVHAVLLCAALGLIVGACGGLSPPAQAASAVLLVFFFSDVGYVAAFQSFYSQTASLLFLMLVVGITSRAVRRGNLSGLWLPAYFFCAALFVCSKPQESVQAVLLASLGVRLAWGGSRRGRAAAIILAVALLGLAGRYYHGAEKALGWITRYNVLFMEALPGSPDPAADLAELGLDPSLARYAGVSAWVDESPIHIAAVRAFVDRSAGQPSPRILYLRHPPRLAALLARVARSSYLLQPQDLGNFAKESGAPPGAKAHGLWSALRTRLSGLPWLLALLGVSLAAAATTHRRASPRGRLFREALTVLVAMTAGAFLVAALGDSRIETVRHLYTFQAMCDLLLVADVGWLVQALAAPGTRVMSP